MLLCLVTNHCQVSKPFDPSPHSICKPYVNTCNRHGHKVEKKLLMNEINFKKNFSSYGKFDKFNQQVFVNKTFVRFLLFKSTKFTFKPDAYRIYFEAWLFSNLIFLLQILKFNFHAINLHASINSKSTQFLWQKLNLDRNSNSNSSFVRFK